MLEKGSSSNHFPRNPRRITRHCAFIYLEMLEEESGAMFMNLSNALGNTILFN